jgi:hypothetical protein
MVMKKMSNLIVDADLTEPPSETSVFRDVTLYAKTFLDHDVLVECEREVVDLYWYWLKRRGAFDFVDDFVEVGGEIGIRLNTRGGSIVVKRLTAETLGFVINRLSLTR